MSNIVISCHVIKIVVGDYGLNFFKAIKTVDTNYYGFNDMPKDISFDIILKYILFWFFYF